MSDDLSDLSHNTEAAIVEFSQAPDLVRPLLFLA
jgi:hypothetical protein